MSHYTEVKSSFNADNEEELIEACKELWPEAKVLQNAKVRGWPGQRQPTADVVVRFRDVESDKQGNYDIGFTKNDDGTYSMSADWYALTYKETRNDEGRCGSAATEGMLKPIYTRKVMEKSVKKNPALRGFRNVTKKNDIVLRKNAAGKEKRYARLVFQRGGYV